MKYKIDLHSHSYLSYDGVMKKKDYSRIFNEEKLHYLAITDHNEIASALELQQLFGDKIIVGEEVKTRSGDIIGLYLNKKVESGLTLEETIFEFRKQGALIYLPHPFEIMRSGISKQEVLNVMKHIDIFEVFNARYIFPGGNLRARRFAKKHELLAAVGSDSHSFNEIGRTYNLINEIPTKDNLLTLLKDSQPVTRYVSPLNYLNPKRNILTKMLNKR